MKRHNLHNSQSLSVLTGRGGGALNAMVIFLICAKSGSRHFVILGSLKAKIVLSKCVQKSGIEVLANGDHQQNFESSPVK